VIVERSVVNHYRHGALEDALLRGLTAVGKISTNCHLMNSHPPRNSISVVGRQQSISSLNSSQRRVRIGSTSAAVSVARRVTLHVITNAASPAWIFARNMSKSPVRCRGASASASWSATGKPAQLSLPFESGSFDGAYMQHVGMNIADKAKLFAEARRVVKSNGIFAIYDIMRRTVGVCSYPFALGLK
jgi:SAM-dependent methyltransferase